LDDATSTYATRRPATTLKGKKLHTFFADRSPGCGQREFRLNFTSSPHLSHRQLSPLLEEPGIYKNRLIFYAAFSGWSGLV
jgi:hypothetical protein